MGTNIVPAQPKKPEADYIHRNMKFDKPKKDLSEKEM